MSVKTTCVVVGGGPAGMVAGLLLARGGVDVTVLEKHDDFLRDFRGDTVHPSTLRLLDELGLFRQFDALPQTRIEGWGMDLPNGRRAQMIDFTRLRMPHRYLSMVPQWDLLALLAEAGRAEPNFTLRMGTGATGLLHESGRVAGVRYEGPDGSGELRADLTIACDGRWSLCRSDAGLVPREYPVGIDLWWFRLPRIDGIGDTLLPRSGGGKFIGIIPRTGYLQTFQFIPKGADARLRARGIEALRDDITTAAPELSSVVGELASMDDVKLLDVKLNHLRRWYVDGLLCIGDAAHAMSPAGGVGINLAIQDAVAAASLLAAPLRDNRLTTKDLAAVQSRRYLAAVTIQNVQRVIHIVMDRAMNGGVRAPSTLLPLLARLPQLSVIPAYVMGVGVRPEHAPAFSRRAPQPASATMDQ